MTSLIESQSILSKSTYTKPVAVILLGPPGAGKGTIAGPLSLTIDLPHISTGDLLRQHIHNQTELGKLAKACMDKGNLVPDDLVLSMLFTRIEQSDCKKGYILDGFPRTLQQAEALDAYFGNDVQIIALYFSASDELLVDRIIGRITCKQCARPYHKLFDPPKKLGFCDDCQTPLFQRVDDEESIVRKRLEVYHKQTQPVIDHYSKKEGVLQEVLAHRSKQEVLDSIRSIAAFQAYD